MHLLNRAAATAGPRPVNSASRVKLARRLVTRENGGGCGVVSISTAHLDVRAARGGLGRVPATLRLPPLALALVARPARASSAAL